jgi:outer membrane receptor protein involved in Fe transport
MQPRSAARPRRGRQAELSSPREQECAATTAAAAGAQKHPGADGTTNGGGNQMNALQQRPRFRAAILATASLWAIGLTASATPALAQAPAEPPASPLPPGEAPPTGTSGLPQELVVTGSRIVRQDYVSNSPIVTIGLEALRQTGSVTIESGLNQLPQFTPGSGATNSFPPTGGRATLNLRGLGTNRLLVLMDGRRVQPGATDGTVDINLIPSALIQSVETITGGASSTYGSDAMAGVVNFKLRRDFQGVQLDAQYGISEKGDAASRQVAVTVGGKFAEDRGHAVLSVEYLSRGSVERIDRDFYALSQLSPLTPNGAVNLGANAPTQAAVNAVFAQYGLLPGTTINRAGPFGFNPDGTLFTAAPVTSPVLNYRGPLNNYLVNYNNSIVANSGLIISLQTPLERYNAFGRAEYEVTDHIRVRGQGLYTTYETEATIAPPAIGLAGQVITVPVTNPFLPADFRTLLASRANPAADFPFTYVFTQFGGLPIRSKYDIYQFAIGLEGDIPDTDWTWDLYASKGRTEVKGGPVGGKNVQLSALNRLLRAPDGGASLCDGGFNPFGIHAVSPSCLNYLLAPQYNESVFKQDVVEANLQGGLFELPAGKLRFAAGGAYRKDSYSFEPDPLTAVGDFLAGNINLPSGGSQDVYEGYAEFLVPVLKDLPLVKSLELNGGYRYSKYRTAGGVHTYKLDANWEVFSSFRLRGGYSRAIKAPSLISMFQPLARASLAVGNPVNAAGQPIFGGDPCDVRSLYRRNGNGDRVRALCAAQGLNPSQLDSYTLTGAAIGIDGTSSGNRNLRPEKADTYSVGAVWRSQFDHPLVSRLSASVDYYDVKITGAVGTFPLAEAVARCYNVNGTSNPGYDIANIYCALLGRRNINGNLQDARVETLNLGAYETSGIDFQVDWALDLGDLGLNDKLGRISLNVVGTHLNKFKLQSLPEGPILSYKGLTSGAINAGALPVWKVNTTMTYAVGRIDLSLRWRYIDSLDDVSRATSPTSTIAGVRTYNYFDLSGRWRVTDRFELRGGVVNLTNKDLPLIGTGPGTSDVTTYDPLLRRFYVAVKATF